MTARDPLDLLAPDEAHLPPSMRTWARIIHLAPQGYGPTVLELRDHNDGQDPDPARKTRYQYLVGRGYVWRRMLPPAPLDQPMDESPWRGERGPAPWEAMTAFAARSPIIAWAREEDPEVRPAIGAPIAERAARNPDGTGSRLVPIYRMPPRDPHDIWADISSRAAPVPCPVPGCAQELVHYEAGYVPGYRVCMAPAPSGHGHLVDTLRHHFSLDHASEYHEIALIRQW